MGNRIFLVTDNHNLVSMTQEPYDSEDLLQDLLARYPDLLASDQIGIGPRRWLLISREISVPDQEFSSSGRWSLDHLFLDQDGIPTLVEVKRSTDTRIRREVVGQMLDYAANAVSYWKPEELRAQFEARVGDSDPNEILAATLGVNSADVFWTSVETNLRAGRIRMIFVADEIPDELRRIVEFLNEQMTPAEVLAIAIRHYSGQEQRSLVPTLYGKTAKAQGSKSSGRGQTWSEDSFFTALSESAGPQAAEIAHQILRWAQSRGLRIWWGSGKQQGSFFPILDRPGSSPFPIGVWTYGSIEIQFQHLQNRMPFNDPQLRREFLDRLNEIPGVSLPDDSLGRRPSFPIRALTDEARLHQFLAVLDWFVEVVLAHT